MSDPGHCRVQSLHIYPVKSCRGIALDRSAVLLEGLKFDREWMIIDDSGRFLTQRELPAMARIATHLEAGFLLLSMFGHGAIRVPLRYQDGPLVAARCWGFAAQALDCGSAAQQWLSQALGTPARLVRFSRHDLRPCNAKWTGSIAARTHFSDGYPILMLGTASVADLRQRMGVDEDSLSIDRFRPNIVVDGLEAYDEDHIDQFSTIDLTVKLVKPCPRCSIPDLDPVTGQVSGPSPLHTLNSYRMDARSEGAVLGVNAVLLRGEGSELTAGQELQVQYRFDA